MTQTLSVPERTVEARNFLKFRCRLKSDFGTDVHRSFSGLYYPRWRSVSLDEVREVRGQIKLFTVFDLEVMFKQDGDYFMPADFTVGAELYLGKSQYSRDGDAKLYVVTSVDTSNLFAASETAPVSSPTRGSAPSSNKINAPIPPVVKKLRDALVERCGGLPQAVKEFGRYFRTPAANGLRFVNPDDFERMCAELDLRFSEAELAALFRAFDRNRDGFVSYDEFSSALRGPLSERREGAIARAFAAVDADRDGIVSPQELQTAMRAHRHPAVVSGELSPTQVQHALSAAWDTRERTGQVPFAEFKDYYAGVSATIESDDEFVALLSALWG